MVVVSPIAPEEEAKAEDLTQLVGEAFTNTSALLQVPLVPMYLQTVITDPRVRFVANQGTMLLDAGIDFDNSYQLDGLPAALTALRITDVTNMAMSGFRTLEHRLTSPTLPTISNSFRSTLDQTRLWLVMESTSLSRTLVPPAWPPRQVRFLSLMS